MCSFNITSTETRCRGEETGSGLTRRRQTWQDLVSQRAEVQQDRGNLQLPDGLDIVVVELRYPMISHFQSRRRDISQEHVQRPARG